MKLCNIYENMTPAYKWCQYSKFLCKSICLYDKHINLLWRITFNGQGIYTEIRDCNKLHSCFTNLFDIKRLNVSFFSHRTIVFLFTIANNYACLETTHNKYFNTLPNYTVFGHTKINKNFFM